VQHDDDDDDEHPGGGATNSNPTRLAALASILALVAASM
jgi:hypothetical protein